MNYSEIALNIVSKEFASKKDKAGKPYIDHLKRVAFNSKKLAATYGLDNKEIEVVEVIALLHDLIEDCPNWNISLVDSVFRNALIIDNLNRLTKKEGQNYDDYIANIRNSYFSKIVKICDLEDNMDITRLTSINEEDIERLKKYHKSYIFLKK